jgi:hypothetical protein
MNTLPSILPKLRKLFQSDESQFVLGTALKFCLISWVAAFMMGYQLYVNARTNFFFFRAHGLADMTDVREAYFDYILSSLMDSLPLIFALFVGLFFLGIYVAKMILRPFKNIGKYCEQVIEHPEIPYEVEQFAGHRLLHRFSELFFEYLRDAKRVGRIEPRPIPPQFTGIHKPVFDGPFLLHYSFFIAMLIIVSVVMIMKVVGEVHENTVQLAIRYLKADPKITSSFFMSQSNMLNEMWVLTAVLVLALYLILALHLYSQVSGASFGIFATMRSFLKGNYSARVHLVGYSFLRDSTRSLNKYLDWVQKNLTKGAGGG